MTAMSTVAALRTAVLLPAFLLVAGCDGGVGPVGETTQAVELDMTGEPEAGTSGLSGMVDLSTLAFEGEKILLVLGDALGVELDRVEIVADDGFRDVAYSIVSLAPGDYTVRVAVDRNGDGDFSDAGDLDGWFNGTAIAPVQDPGAAAAIPVGATAVTGADFGIGPIPGTI